MTAHITFKSIDKIIVLHIQKKELNIFEIKLDLKI